ncbi:MAG: hypothetical protein AB8G11_15955 [Saprospiraceae bacterium]
MNLKDNLLQSFLTVYFHKIETLLNENPSGLENVKFQSEEANTDEYIKKFFQEYLATHNNITDSTLNQLVIKIDGKSHFIDIEQLKEYQIVAVLLPENLNEQQKKEIAKGKNSVYTNPDLYLKITDGSNFFFESVELKSTKNNKIPGSSVQQVSPFEWVIFIKRAKEIQVTTGFYINSITEKLPFPDRSPRPQIGFKTLVNWNKKHRKVHKTILEINNVTEITNAKIELLDDWQDFLASEWLEIILKNERKKTEKWFNNAIRKFAVKLLEHYDKIDSKERVKMLNNLKELIK